MSVKKYVGNSPAQEQGEGGFSLIELMIAITVLTFGLVSIVGITAYVSRTNATSNILNVLATTAQDQADKLRYAAWDTITEDPKLTIGGNTNYASSDSNHRATAANTPAGVINISWAVANGPGTTGDIRTVTIKAAQVNSPERLAQGVSITLIIAKN
jgi:prepilin-type N-terminal cleavage/methylation domain-containing protein